MPFAGVFEEPLLGEVPYDALDRVEIVKGPLSVLYGRGAIYGGVNYITRDPDRNGATASLAAGSDDYYRGSASVTRSFSGGGGLVLRRGL